MRVELCYRRFEYRENPDCKNRRIRLWRKRDPFTDKTAYEVAQVTFITNDSEVSLSRSTRTQNTIHVESSNPAVASGSYSVSSRSGKSINTVLLALLGIEPTRRIATNETYHTVAFTWNAVRHLMLVPEDQVGRPQPSILFPKSTTLTTLTQSLSSLLVLVQDDKIDSSMQTESASEHRTRRKAVEQFIHQQLDDIEPRIKRLEEMRHIATNEGKTVHTYLEALRKKHCMWSSKGKLFSTKMPVPSHISRSLINNMSILRYLFASARYLSVNMNQTLHALICNYKR